VILTQRIRRRRRRSVPDHCAYAQDRHSQHSVPRPSTSCRSPSVTRCPLTAIGVSQIGVVLASIALRLTSGLYKVAQRRLSASGRHSTDGAWYFWYSGTGATAGCQRKNGKRHSDPEAHLRRSCSRLEPHGPLGDDFAAPRPLRRASIRTRGGGSPEVEVVKLAQRRVGPHRDPPPGTWVASSIRRRNR
jgi:hypothetical protein